MLRVVNVWVLKWLLNSK